MIKIDTPLAARAYKLHTEGLSLWQIAKELKLFFTSRFGEKKPNVNKVARLLAHVRTIKNESQTLEGEMNKINKEAL
jgi:hypothetical protein